jgi:protein Tex
MWSRGRLESRVRAGQQEAGAKFSDYFDFAEAFTRLPSHRILALFRGEKEEVLDLSFEPEVALSPDRRRDGPSWYELRVARRFAVSDRGRPADLWLMDWCADRGAPASSPGWPATFESA